MSLLEVTGLGVDYPLPRRLADVVTRAPRRTVRAVNGVSFRVERGETLGLVGESGCGKSSLGRALLRLTPASGGTVRFDGEDVLGLDPRQLFAFRRRAQMVFQEPHASLNPMRTVEETLSEVLRVHGVCAEPEIPARVGALMARVGLPEELRSRRPRALSGGQCQRVGIARALALDPELIVSDESLSALDVSIQAQILNLYLDLKGPGELAMIFISHDLGVVRHVCHRVAVMYLGRIVEIGPTEEVFARPRHPYTRMLVAAIPRTEPDAPPPAAADAGEPPSPIAMPAGCPFHPRCPQAMPSCRADPPPGGRRDGTVDVACHLYPEA